MHMKHQQDSQDQKSGHFGYLLSKGDFNNFKKLNGGVFHCWEGHFFLELVDDERHFGTPLVSYLIRFPYYLWNSLPNHGSILEKKVLSVKHFFR